MGCSESLPVQMDRAIKTVIFDLDGTILDTLPDLVLITNTALAEHGFAERTQAEILSFVGNGPRALLSQAVPEDTSEKIIDETFATWKRVHDEIDGLQTRAFPGIGEAVLALREAGVRVGVLSNKYDQAVQRIMAAKMPGLFEVMHGDSDEYPRKPDPTGLLKTIAELGGAPQTTAYVGDSPSDMEVARRAGCMRVAVSWGYRAPETLAPLCDCLVHDAAELLNIIK